jgi:hypothetical protein
MKFKLLLIFISTFLSFSALAEKWVAVGGDIYIDTDSKSRNGDLAKITVKVGRVEGTSEVDCINFKFIYPPSWGEDKVPKGSPLGEVITTACNRWYEVWK